MSIIVIIVFVVFLKFAMEPDKHFIIRKNPFSALNTENENYNQSPKYLRFKNNYSMKALNQFMEREIPFYRLLSKREKYEFLVRLRLMLKHKYFSGRQGLTVTDDMMLIFGGLMVQITFGFKDFTFPHFACVAIFPDVFYSRLFEKYVKGLTVYHNGIIFVSWPDVVDGIDNETDKLNLALHELAHALYLDYFEHDPAVNGFGRWLTHAVPELEKMKTSGKQMFLRSYAASNIHEFWAVCIEHFFEAPLEFQKEMPELYREMCIVLNQDMASRLQRAIDSDQRKLLDAA